MGAPELIGHEGRLGGRSRQHPHLQRGPRRPRRDGRDPAVRHRPRDPVGDPPTGLHQQRWEPPGLGQRYGLVDLDRRHGTGHSPAEREDRLIGIPHHDKLVGSRGQQVDEPGLRWIDILILVHEDSADPPLLGGKHFGVTELLQRGDGQLSLVEGGARPARRGPQGRHLAVLRDEVRDGAPFRSTMTSRQRHQPRWRDLPLGTAQHDVAQFGGEPRHRQGPAQLLGPASSTGLHLAGEQVADDQIRLARGQHAWRGFAVGVGGETNQRVAVGVQGPHRRLDGGDLDQTRDPGRQLCRSPPGECQHEDRRRVGAVGDPGRHRGSDRGRFAGARPGQHLQPSSAVPDHPLLFGRRGEPDRCGRALRLGTQTGRRRSGEGGGHALDGITRVRQCRSGRLFVSPSCRHSPCAARWSGRVSHHRSVPRRPIRPRRASCGVARSREVAWPCRCRAGSRVRPDPGGPPPPGTRWQRGRPRTATSRCPRWR